MEHSRWWREKTWWARTAKNRGRCCVGTLDPKTRGQARALTHHESDSAFHPCGVGGVWCVVPLRCSAAAATASSTLHSTNLYITQHIPMAMNFEAATRCTLHARTSLVSIIYFILRPCALHEQRGQCAAPLQARTAGAGPPVVGWAAGSGSLACTGEQGTSVSCACVVALQCRRGHGAGPAPV